MAQSFWRVERGIRITDSNTFTGISILKDSGAPGSRTDENDAEVGSLYMQTDGAGHLFRKKTAGSGTDKWVRLSTYDDVLGLSFRSEVVRAATGDAAPVSGSSIDLSSAPFGDDDDPDLTAADFTVDDHIIFGVGGTPKLMRVSVVSAPSITVVDAADALADNDNFVVRYYLPDSPDGQEKQAIVHYNGSAIIKLSDFNWELADGISLISGYAAQNGSITNADSVETAIEKLDGNQQDLITLSGVAQGEVDLGTFTGDTIPDDSDVKEALQALETKVEAVAAASGNYSQQTNVVSATVIDEILVDDILACEWQVHIREEATPANIAVFTVAATHDGTASGDAAAVDHSIYSKLKLNSNFNYTVTVELSGTGAAQKMQLKVASTTAGVTVTARREDVYYPA